MKTNLLTTRNDSLPAVASGSNRVNTSSEAPISTANRTSLFITQLLQGGESLPVPCTGTQFYVVFASAPISIKPNNRAANEFSTGKGLNLDLANAFSLLTIKNTTAQPVVFQIFVGFDKYIDNTLVSVNNVLAQATYPTYPTANSATTVDINDLSGTAFNDINGNKWYAVSREAIYLFNVDTGVTALLQKSGALTASGPAIAAIYPQTSLRMACNGDYSINVGGGNVNMVISEIYNAIKANS